MQDRKLEQALDIYFQDRSDREAKEFQEAQKYLKLRIRPAMEFLIEKEDTEKSWRISSDMRRRKQNCVRWYGCFISKTGNTVIGRKTFLCNPAETENGEIQL